MAAYTFDPRASRYRAPNGQFVSEEQLHAAVLKAADAAGERMAALTTRLQAGKLSLADWEAQMLGEIRSTHVAASLAAHGGRAMASQADYAVISAQVRQQYQFLHSWATDIANSKAPLNGLLVNRARLYARSSIGSFEGMKERDARNSGAQMEERNVLGAAEHHCSECPELPRGWLPLGTLPPVGTRECGANDRCRIERRLVPVAAEAA